MGKDKTKEKARGKAAPYAVGKKGGKGESVPDDIAKKILREAKIQRQEVEDEAEGTMKKRLQQAVDDGEIEDFEIEEEEDEEEANYTGELNLDAEEEKAMEMFMRGGSERRRTLGEIVAEKLREQQRADEASSSGGVEQGMMAEDEEEGHHHHGDHCGCEGHSAPPMMAHVDPRVVEIYKNVGEYLKGYTSGKLPKPFKVLPSLNNWEDLLFITRPDEWSPHAMRAAVKLFAAGLNTKMAQRFYNIVLLPCFREAVRGGRKLNFHLYLALKKALYRPTAFYKGFLLPLCEAGDCTLREAVIVSSILTKVSIPMYHSAAAMVKICEMPYSGANSMFLRTLFDKKYSLPHKVIDVAVDHFTRFASDARQMVVVWHQSLLFFVQRYKTDLTAEQKDRLRALLRVHSHPLITPDIRFELDSSACRGQQK